MDERNRKNSSSDVSRKYATGAPYDKTPDRPHRKAPESINRRAGSAEARQRIKTAPPRPQRPEGRNAYRREATGRDAEKVAKETLFDKIKKKLTPKIMVIAAAVGVVGVLLICMLINIIIGVRTIEVKGNRLAPREEILNVAGISSGSGYFSYNTRRSEKKVIENINCIADINISRSAFGKVTITVTEKNACWYTEVHGEYYALSDELEVIRCSQLRDEFILNDLVRLDFPEVKSIKLGKTVEYADGDRNCAFVTGFLDEIRSSEMYKNGRIDQVEMKTKYEIFIVCDMKYKVHIGKSEGVGKKLTNVKIMLENSIFSSDDLFEIDASDIGNITSRVNGELDFSHLKPVSKG